MFQMFNPLLRILPILSFIVLNTMDYGFFSIPFHDDVWSPPTSTPSTYPLALMHHPLKINCPFRRHASSLLPLCTMASSRSFCPSTPFDSHNLIHSQASCLEEALLVVISGFDEGFDQGIPWETLPLIRRFVKERLALAAFLN